MRILLVAQEHDKVSKGTVRVWLTLYESWSGHGHVTMLLNRAHWMAECIECMRLPFRIPSEYFADRRATGALRVAYAVFRRVAAIVIAPIAIVWLARWLRRRRFDAVLSHNGGWPGGELNRWVMYAAFLAGITRRVLVIHNVPAPYRLIHQPWRPAAEWLMGRIATALVTVSHMCKLSLERGTFFGRSLHVVHNGIVFNDIDRGARLPHAPWRGDRPTIGFVGELSPRKGVHLLIDALGAVDTPCQLVLVGTGDSAYIESLKALAARSPWDVYFLGFRDDTADLYPRFDIVVLPSLALESFGMVLLEAMAYEKPVICSRFGGMPEVVADGETGFVVDANSAGALASALNRLVADARLRERMGKAGRRRLEEHFTAAQMTEHYVALLQTQPTC